MRDSELAKVLNTRDELLEQPACLLFLQMVLGSDVVKQLSIAAVLHDQKQPLRCFYDLVHLNDMGVSDDFEDVDLSLNTLNIVYIVNFPLFKNLDGDLLACVDVISLLDLSESALTKSFLDFVVSNHSLAIFNFVLHLVWPQNFRDSTALIDFIQAIERLLQL